MFEIKTTSVIYLAVWMFLSVFILENVKCLPQCPNKELLPNAYIECDSVNSSWYKFQKENDVKSCDEPFKCKDYVHSMYFGTKPVSYPGRTLACVRNTHASCCSKHLVIDLQECLMGSVSRKQEIQFRYMLRSCNDTGDVCSLKDLCDDYYCLQGNSTCRRQTDANGAYSLYCGEQSSSVVTMMTSTWITSSSSTTTPSSSTSSSVSSSSTTSSSTSSSTSPSSTTSSSSTSSSTLLSSSSLSTLSPSSTSSTSQTLSLLPSSSSLNSSFVAAVSATTELKPTLTLLNTVASSSVITKPVGNQVEVNFVVRFTDVQWHQNYSDLTSQESLDLISQIQSNTQTFFSGLNSSFNITVNSLRKGSVIASFSIVFSKLAPLQILKVQDDFHTTGKLFQFTATLLNITSNKVPSTAPIIQTAKSTSSTDVFIQWTVITTSNLLGYKVLYKKQNVPNDPWAYALVGKSDHKVLVQGLLDYTEYSFRVLGFSGDGDGVASEPIIVKTDEGVPSIPPSDPDVTVLSSSVLSLAWFPLTPHQIRGKLVGYNVFYTWNDKANNGTRQNFTLASPLMFHILLEGLQKNTKYSLSVSGCTSKGCGPWSKNITAKTDADVPSSPPTSVTSLNLTSTSSVTINWSPIPFAHQNSHMIGYRIKYTLTISSEIAVADVESRTVHVGPSVRSVVLTGLLSNSVYEVRVAGVNNVGVGPEEIIYTETCRCPEILYTNYWANPPYLRHNKTTGTISGIFPTIVTNMLTWACGNCSNGHQQTDIDMTSNGKRMSSLKDSVAKVLSDIDDTTHISFPIYGNKDLDIYKGVHRYIHIVDSPGIAFIKVKEKSDPITLDAVVQCFPLIGLVLVLALIAGVVFWTLEFRSNSKQFPEQFSSGVREGFWFSVITMTTVGYGDVKPLTNIGRVFAIVWTLVGLIMISIFLSVLASFLTTIALEDNIIIYSTKVAAIQNSSEYQIAVRKNGKVNQEKQYLNIADIKQALSNKEVKAALIDTYVAADQKDQLFDDNIEVQKIFDKKIGYGLVLSGEVTVLYKRCKDYVARNKEAIVYNITKMTETVQASSKSRAVSASESLLDPSSNMFIQAVQWSGACLMVACVLGVCWNTFVLPGKKGRVNPNEQKKYKNTKDEMNKVVVTWYNDVQVRMQTLRNRHKRQLQQLIKIRKKNMKNE